jgi:hypothetical protein
MRRQMNGKAPAGAADLNANEPKGQPRDPNVNIDEGIQVLALDGSKIPDRERDTFGVVVIGHGWRVRQSEGKPMLAVVP